MDFEGKVLQILPPTKGTSARGEWQRQEVIFEMTQEFSRKVAVTFFNKPTDVEKLRVGESYIVSVNVESREYNGRWYTDASAWRIEAADAAQPAPAPQPMAPAAQSPQSNAGAFPPPPIANDANDDLPF